MNGHTFVDLVLVVVLSLSLLMFMLYCLAAREPLKRSEIESLYSINKQIRCNELKSGDLIFFSSGTKYDIKDHILRLGGGSHFTHVAIVVEFNQVPYILESVRAGVRIRYAHSNFQNFLKKTSYNSILVKHKIIPVKESLMHLAVQRTLGSAYSFDFMPGFCDRVVTFFPLPLFDSYQHPQTETSQSFGYSCLSLVLSCLRNELKTLLELDTSNIRSIQELFDSDKDQRDFTNPFLLKIN